MNNDVKAIKECRCLRELNVFLDVSDGSVSGS